MTLGCVLARALAIQNFVDPIKPELFANCVEECFEQFRKIIVTRRRHLEVASKQLSKANDVLVYTDRIMENKEEAIKHLATRGVSVEMVEEDKMYRTVFISYGGPDHLIVSRIYKVLKKQGIKTWFFPNDAEAGAKLHRVMSEQVGKYDRVLLVCSKASLSRPDVQNEIERVLEREAREGGTEILVPITIDDFVYNAWQPVRKDVADQIRARVIAKIEIEEEKKMEEGLARVWKSLRL